MASDNVYKIYASVTASTDAAAQIDVPTAGMITGLWGYMNVLNPNAGNDGAAFEISFASSSQFLTTDTRSSIFGAGMRATYLTSGGINSSVQFASPPVKIPVGLNERIYLHINEDGAPNSIEVTCWFQVVTAPVAQRRVRRVRRG